ncbi:MAG: ring-cleaving dioxygenase [Fimbriimonadaceae bacterium]|jgi:glyoxalase family protein|nr:ring-cleaving dioxygenase [Fimbriimonadaceae bacterium]
MSERKDILGLHHVTAVCRAPQENVTFYEGLLGLRLIKVTVNYDDPETYHLYYGDGLGRPGTVITFFPYGGARQGRVGTGQVVATAFIIPKGSLDFWVSRLSESNVNFALQESRFGDRVILLDDPDAMPVELIESQAPDNLLGDQAGAVPAEYAIRGFHSVTLKVGRWDETVRMLVDVMGFRRVGQEGERLRLESGDGGASTIVDLIPGTQEEMGRGGTGTVHHVAFRLADDAVQEHWLSHFHERGVQVTPVQNRTYFHSIYFREPSGVLYEIATDQPGFSLDEPVEHLGENLQLPAWLEGQRTSIARGLVPFTTAAGVAFP